MNIEKADDNDDDYHMVLTTETEDEDEFPPLPRAESTQAASENTQTDAKTVNTPGLNAAITDPLLAAIGQPTSASVSVPSPEQANTFIASASAAWIAVSAAALALLPRYAKLLAEQTYRIYLQHDHSRRAGCCQQLQ